MVANQTSNADSVMSVNKCCIQVPDVTGHPDLEHREVEGPVRAGKAQ
jgi:hypothetical protein